MLRYIVEHGAQVFQVENQQSALIGNAEHDVQHAILRLIQVEQTTEQLRTHLRNGGTHGMALFAKHIEKAYRTALELRILDAKLGHTLLDKAAQLTSLRDSRKVALHVGHETGHACLAERFGHHLQRDRLTRTRSTGNKSVAISHFTVDTQRAVSAMGDI